jgi:hypothetical protein
MILFDPAGGVMNKKTQVLVLTLTALTTVACSHTPMPVAKNFAHSEQRVMQAAHHWDVLAAVVAEKVYNKLNTEHSAQPVHALISSPAASPLPLPTTPTVAESPPIVMFNPQSTDGNYTPLNLYTGAGVTPSESYQPVSTYSAPEVSSPGFSSAATIMHTAAFPPLYLPAPSENAPIFNKTFYNLLRSHLIRNDLMVVNRSDGPYSACYSPNVPCKALTMEYDINVVQHKDRNAPFRLPGRITALATAGAISAYIINNVEHYGQAAWSVIPVIGLLEWPNFKRMYWPDETNTEVAITVTATDGDFVIFSDSNIFYINTGDSDHYEKRARTFRMVSQ